MAFKPLSRGITGYHRIAAVSGFNLFYPNGPHSGIYQGPSSLLIGMSEPAKERGHSKPKGEEDD
jgi:hypothetical protein